MHRIQSIVTAAVLAASMVFGTAPVQADTLLTTVPGVVVSRISGSNRYATAYAIAAKAFQSSVSEAVLVSGANFPDALAASGYAGMKKCPVLITAPDTLSSQTQKFIQEKNIKKITIIGGTSAVSSAVENKLVSSCGIPQSSITRVKGNNRRETAEEVEKAGGFDKTGACVITSGSTPADALSISPWCYKNKWPIFLADGNGDLSSTALDAAKSYAHVYILGSTKSVGAATASALPNSERIEGKNRYETSVKIASKFAAGYNNTLIASGQNSKFADALSGAMLAGLTNVPIILADSKSDAGTTLMKGKAASISRIYVLGSANSVSDLVVGTIRGRKFGGVKKIKEGTDNVVSLSGDGETDTIRYVTHSNGFCIDSYDLYVNGTHHSIGLPSEIFGVTLYAADLNIADDTKDLFVDLGMEDTMGQLFLYEFSGTSITWVKKWSNSPSSSETGDFKGGRLLTNWIDGSGVFKYTTSANFGVKRNGNEFSMRFMHKGYISDTSLTEQILSSGYFKRFATDLTPADFVQPFTFVMIAPIKLYSDSACTKVSGSISKSKTVTLLSYQLHYKSRCTYYVSISGGAKGWIKDSDLTIRTVYNYYAFG